MTEIMPFPKTIYCFIGPPLRAAFWYLARQYAPVRESVSLLQIINEVFTLPSHPVKVKLSVGCYTFSRISTASFTVNTILHGFAFGATASDEPANTVVRQTVHGDFLITWD